MQQYHGALSNHISSIVYTCDRSGCLVLTFGGIPYMPCYHLADVYGLILCSLHNVTGKGGAKCHVEQRHTCIDEAERVTGSAWSKEARRSCAL